MIDPGHTLPITRQATLLELSRSAVYYQPRPISEAELDLMNRLDCLHLEYPFAGSHMLRDMLWMQGVRTGRRRARTLMKRMGIAALYRKPRTTKPGEGHRI